MIKIVGLGPGSPEALTIGAVEALQESKNLYFRTEKHPTVDYLKNKLEGLKLVLITMKKEVVLMRYILILLEI